MNQVCPVNCLQWSYILFIYKNIRYVRGNGGTQEEGGFWRGGI